MIGFIFGERELIFEKKHVKDVFSILSCADIPFRESENGEKVRLWIPFYAKRKLRAELEKKGIEIEFGRIEGLPAFLYRYRKRWGIQIGLLIMVVMVFLSGKVIWCIDIEGNEKVSDREIIELLDKLGCGIGDRYEDIDFDVLHNRFLIESNSISWISVNMNGTHANVEVKEISTENGSNSAEGFFNVVASEAGQIEQLENIEGKPVVDIGDTVLEGELLISGAISYRNDTLSRFESADGGVLARVNRSFEVVVPLENEVKSYTGNESVECTFSFFNFDINLFGNSRNSYEVCDKITVYKQMCLFDSVELPMFLEKTVYKEYEMIPRTLSKNEARDAAYIEYRKKLSENLSDAKIISKEVNEEFDKKSYRINCSLYCLTDIGKKVPLVISKENNNTETEK